MGNRGVIDEFSLVPPISFRENLNFPWGDLPEISYASAAGTGRDAHGTQRAIGREGGAL